MNYYFLIPLLAFFINGFAWVYIYAQRKRDKIKNAFLIYLTFLNIWILGVFLTRIIPHPLTIEIILKIESAGWLSIGFWFMNFTYVFLNKKRNLYYYLTAVLFTATLILSLTTHLIINSYNNLSWGPDEEIGALFMPAIFVVIIIPGIYSLLLLWKEVRTTNNHSRKQAIKFLLAGSFIALIVGIISNVIIPYLMLNREIVQFAESSTVIQSFLIFSAMTKYRLFKIDIEEISEELFSNMYDGAVILDKENEIIKYNEATSIILAGNISVIQKILAELDAENSVKKDFYFNFNGVEKYLTVTRNIIADSEFEIGKFLIIHDITERKRAESEIIKAKETAEEMNELKTNFLANMSHEFKTPLISILGFAEILKDELHDEYYKTMSDSIRESGKRLLNTLNLVLNLTKLEKKEVKVRNKELNLIQVIGSVIRQFEEAAIQKNLVIKFHFEYEMMPVITDENLLYQILYNIINNAVKFTPLGAITISVNKVIRNGSEKAEIIISDTGIGIPENKLNVIFKEFRQASEGLSRSFEGTGLGLSLSKKYADILGFDLDIVSNSGTGTDVKLEISLSEVDPEIESYEELFLNDKKRLLLVEDDDATIRVLTAFLKQSFSVDVTKKGEDAIEKFYSTYYNAVLMDINLGSGINGVETAQKIRQLNNYIDQPIIAITAYDMRYEENFILESGCTHYLAKPFDKKEIHKTLSKALRKSA